MLKRKCGEFKWLATSIRPLLKIKLFSRELTINFVKEWIEIEPLRASQLMSARLQFKLRRIK